jgi:hypothetical protein
MFLEMPHNNLTTQIRNKMPNEMAIRAERLKLTTSFKTSGAIDTHPSHASRKILLRTVDDPDPAVVDPMC